MKDINGIILSGGQSSRMGVDKALLKVGAKTIIEIIIDKLKPICTEIIISADDVEKYSRFGLQVVPDKYKDSGPLAGIYSSLLQSKSEKNFIISCDLPFVSSELINQLIDTKSDKEIVLPAVGGKYHQLCGVYSKSILGRTEEILRGGELGKRGKGEGGKRRRGEGRKRDTSVKKLLDMSEVDFVDVTDVVKENEFLNMNTKEDFAIIEKLLTTSN